MMSQPRSPPLSPKNCQSAGGIHRPVGFAASKDEPVGSGNGAIETRVRRASRERQSGTVQRPGRYTWSKLHLDSWSPSVLDSEVMPPRNQGWILLFQSLTRDIVRTDPRSCRC